MRIREENCNMVLLAAVALFGTVVAGGAALFDDPAAAASGPKPAYLVETETRPADAKPADVTDRGPVRVVGTPFVPNTNPSER